MGASWAWYGLMGIMAGLAQNLTLIQQLQEAVGAVQCTAANWTELKWYTSEAYQEKGYWIDNNNRMEASELDEGMKVLDSCLTNINWRLKPSSKRRLQLGFLLTSLFSISFFLSSLILIPFMASLQICLLWSQECDRL